MIKTNPNLDKSKALDRLMNYSKEETNTEMFFTGMPTYSPQFKER